MTWDTDTRDTAYLYPSLTIEEWKPPSGGEFSLGDHHEASPLHTPGLPSAVSAYALTSTIASSRAPRRA